MSTGLKVGDNNTWSSAGELKASGAISGASLSATGNISTTSGNISGVNVSASGTVSGATLSATGNISTTTGTVSGNLVTSITGFQGAGNAYHLTGSELKVSNGNTWTSGGTLTASGAIKGASLSDGTATLSSGNITGLNSINNTSVQDIKDAVTKTTGLSYHSGTTTTSVAGKLTVTDDITTTGKVQGTTVQGTTISDGTAQLTGGKFTNLAQINGTNVTDIQGAVTKTTGISYVVGTGTTVDGVTMNQGAVTGVTSLNGVSAETLTNLPDRVTTVEGKTTAITHDTAGTHVDGDLLVTGAITGNSISATSGTIGGVTLSGGSISATGGLTVGTDANFSGGATFNNGVNIASGKTLSNGTASLTDGALTGLVTLNGTNVTDIQNTVTNTAGISRAGTATTIEGLFKVDSTANTAKFQAAESNVPIYFTATGIKVGDNSAYVQQDGFRAGTTENYGQLTTAGLTVGTGATSETNLGTQKAKIESTSGNITTAGTLSLGNGAIGSGLVTLSSDGTNLVSSNAIKSTNGFVVSNTNQLTSDGIKASAGSIAGMTFDSTSGITTNGKNIDAGAGTVSATNLKATNLIDGASATPSSVTVANLIADHGNIAGITRDGTTTKIENTLSVTQDSGFGLVNGNFGVDSNGNVTSKGNITATGSLTLGTGGNVTTLTSDATGLSIGSDKTFIVGSTTVKSGEINTGTNGNVKTAKINDITVTGATTTGLTFGGNASVGGTNPFSSTGFTVDTAGNTDVESLKVNGTTRITNAGDATLKSVTIDGGTYTIDASGNATLNGISGQSLDVQGLQVTSTGTTADNLKVTDTLTVGASTLKDSASGLKVTPTNGKLLVGDNVAVGTDGTLTGITGIDGVAVSGSAAAGLTLGTATVGGSTNAFSSTGYAVDTSGNTTVNSLKIGATDYGIDSNGKVTAPSVQTTTLIDGANPNNSIAVAALMTDHSNTAGISRSSTSTYTTTIEGLLTVNQNTGIAFTNNKFAVDTSGNITAAGSLTLGSGTSAIGLTAGTNGLDLTGTTKQLNVGSTKIKDTGITADAVTATTGTVGKFKFDGATLTNSDGTSNALTIQGVDFTQGKIEGIGFADQAITNLTSLDGVDVTGDVSNGLKIGTGTTQATIGSANNAFASAGFAVNGSGDTTVNSLKIGSTEYGISSTGVLKAADGSTVGGVTLSGGTVTGTTFAGTTLKDTETNNTIGIGDIITDHGNIAGITRAQSGSSYKTTVEGLFTVDAGTNKATFQADTANSTPIYFTSKGIKVGNNSAYVNQDGFRAGTAGTYSEMTNVRVLMGTGASNFDMTSDPTYGTNTLGMVAASGNIGTKGTVMIGATSIDSAGVATGGVTLSKNADGQLESDAAIKSANGFIVDTDNQLTSAGITATAGTIAGMTFDSTDGITTGNRDINAGTGKVTAKDVQATNLIDNADPAKSIAVSALITDHSNVAGISRVDGVTTIENTFSVDPNTGIALTNGKFGVDLTGNITGAGTLTLGQAGGTNTLTAGTDGLTLTGTKAQLNVGDTTVNETSVTTGDVTADTATLGDFKFDGSALTNKNGVATPLTIQNLSITDKAIEGIGFNNTAMTGLTSLDNVKVAGTQANGLTFGDGAGAATVGGTSYAFKSNGYSVDTAGNVTAQNLTAQDTKVKSLNVNDKASIDANGVATFGTSTSDQTVINNGTISTKTVNATDVTADTLTANTSADLGKFHIVGNTMDNKDGGTNPLIIEGISLVNGEMSGVTKFDGVAVTGDAASGLTFGTGNGAATIGNPNTPFASNGFSVTNTGATDVKSLSVNGTERINTAGDGTLNSLLIGTVANQKAKITSDGDATVKSLSIGTTGYGIDADGVIKGADNSVIGGVTMAGGAITAPNGGTIANAVFSGDSINNKDSANPLTIEGVDLKNGTISTTSATGANTTINQGNASFTDGNGKTTTISSGGAVYNGGGANNTTSIDGGTITTETVKTNRLVLGNGDSASSITLDQNGAASFAGGLFNIESNGDLIVKKSVNGATTLSYDNQGETLTVGSAADNQTIIAKGTLNATATDGTNVNHRVSTATEDTTAVSATGFTGTRTIQSASKQIQDSLAAGNFTASRTMDGTAQTMTDTLNSGSNTVSEVKSIGTPSNVLTVQTDASHSNITTDLANASTKVITDGQTTATSTQSLTTLAESLVNGDKVVSETKQFGSTNSTLKDTNVSITTDSVLSGNGGVPTTTTVLSKGATGAEVTNTIENTNTKSSITLADAANRADTASMSLDRSTHEADLYIASDATHFVADVKSLNGFGTTLNQGTNSATDAVMLDSSHQFAMRTIAYNGVTTIDKQDANSKVATTSVTEGANTVSDVLDLANGNITNTVTKDGKTTTTTVTNSNYAITGSTAASGNLKGTTSATDDATAVTAGAAWTGNVGLNLDTTTGETTLRTASNGYSVLNGGKASFVSQSGTNYVDINDGTLTVVNNDNTGAGTGTYSNKRVTTITGGKVTTDTLYVDSLIFGESISTNDPTTPTDTGNYIRVDGSASLANGKFKVSQDGYVTNIFPHATDDGYDQYLTTFTTNQYGVNLSYEDKTAQTLSSISVGTDANGRANSIVSGLTSTDPTLLNTKNVTTTLIDKTTHVVASETASNTAVQTADKTASSLASADGTKSIESAQSISGTNVTDTSTMKNGSNTITNSQTVAANKATSSTVVKDTNGTASNTLTGGQATTAVTDTSGKSSTITTTADGGTVFTNSNANTPFVNGGATTTTIKGNTITTGQITTDKLVITGNHSDGSDGQGNGGNTPGGAVVIAGDGTFSSMVAGVDNTGKTSELSNTVNGVVASASDGTYTGKSNVTATNVTNGVSNTDGTIESSTVNNVDENGNATLTNTIKDAAGTNINTETSTASAKTITGLGDNAGKVASQTLNLDQAQTKLANGDSSNTVTRELAKTSDILMNGTKTNSLIRTLDDSTMSISDGTNTNTILHNATSSTQTFSNGSKTSTITTNSDGMTVNTNGKTATVSGEDVVIKKGTSEEVKLSDLGKVQKIVDGLKPVDGSDNTTVVDSLNTEYQQRVAADEALNNRVTKLNQQVDRVGALAAAMSTLEPLPYDKDAPTSINAAVGTYKGESAVAIGVNHYSNQDTMLTFKIGKSGSDTMAGFGASFRIGRKSPQQIIENERAKAERQVAAAQERALAAHRLYEQTVKALEEAKKIAEENQQLQIQEAAKSEQAAKDRLEQVKAQQNKDLAPSYQVK